MFSLNSSGPGSGTAADSSKYVNETLGFTQLEESVGLLKNYWLVKAELFHAVTSVVAVMMMMMMMMMMITSQYH